MYNHIKRFFRETLARSLSFLLISVFLISLAPVSKIYAGEEDTSTEEESSADESTEVSTTTVITHTIFHKHTGSRDHGGGCYSVKRTGTRTVEVRCSGTLIYYPGYDSTGCSECGAGYSGSYHAGERCMHSTTHSESYTYYDLGCGRSTSSVVGSITVTYDDSEWSKEIPATVTYTAEDMTPADNPYRMNDETNDTGEFTITENGDYTFSIDADPNADTSGGAVTISIDKIDHTSPTVGDYYLSPTEWVREGVTLYLEDVKDLQPDGSDGCGLDDNAFSYDGGVTWCNEDTHFFTDNGDYSAMIRDKLGNTTTIEFTIDNIDHEAPNVRYDYDKTKNLLKTELTVEADDILSDMREGVGLDELPFSYDGGITWTEKTKLPISSNQIILLRVRDKLGNTFEADIDIDNLDTYAPTVTYTLYPDYWTNKNVEIWLDARDINDDGSDGIGLPDDCYSYNNGESWTDEDEMLATDNGDYFVCVRDKYDHRNYFGLTVRNIDRIAPTVSLSYELSADGYHARLIADATDSESGIAGYSWDGAYFCSSNMIDVESNGTYTVTVKDRAGNTACASVDISDIKLHIIPRLTDEVQLSDTPEKKSEIRVQNEHLISKKTPIVRSLERQDRLSPFMLALIILGIILALLLLFLLAFLLTRCVRIYAENSEEKPIFLGISFIHLKDEKYYFEVKQELWDKAETTHFCFKITRLFVFLHPNEDIYIHFPDNQVRCMQLQKQINVTIK